MKKIAKFLLLLIPVFFFSSCYNEVFYQVMQDVAPEEATVSGTINAITRYDIGSERYLVLNANGGLRYKKASDTEYGKWKTYPAESLPFQLHHYDYYGAQEHVGQQIIKVVADSSNLYLVTVEYFNYTDEGTNSPKKVHLWQVQMKDSDNNGEWDAISTDKWTDLCAEEDYLPVFFATDYYYSAFSVFCTNAPQNNHRFAYIRKGDVNSNSSEYTTPVYYKLNGASAPSEISISATDTNSSADGISSAVYYNDEVLFFNSIAAITNETFTEDATHFYFAGNSSSSSADYYYGYLYYNKTPGEKDITTNKTAAGTQISSLAFCSDAILVGKANYSSTSSSSSGGIVKFQVTNGIPSEDLGTFTTNANNQLLSAYFLLALLNTDPSQSETESSIYASLDFLGTGSSTSATAKSRGLWAYYPERANWNRE